jgi:hypothetical protein
MTQLAVDVDSLGAQDPYRLSQPALGVRIS